MVSFSERHGYKPAKLIQIDSVDRDLRVGLWNALNALCLQGEIFNHIIVDIYLEFLKKTVDEIPLSTDSARHDIKKFFFECLWYQVYDFMEFCLNSSIPKENSMVLKLECNRVMEREFSGYRFVGDKITKITSEEEISEIEEVLEKSQPLAGVSTHIKDALSLMSDRNSPNYRNSIKESISAVEAICVSIAGDRNASLGMALNKISKQGKVPIHGALNKAFQNLYGYTSVASILK